MQVVVVRLGTVSEPTFLSIRVTEDNAPLHTLLSPRRSQMSPGHLLGLPLLLLLELRRHCRTHLAFLRSCRVLHPLLSSRQRMCSPRR